MMWPTLTTERAVLLAGAAVVLAVALARCAPAGRSLKHSPEWLLCREQCKEAGGSDPTVIEMDNARGCICKKSEAI